MSSPCEDGIHLLMVAGPADLTRGSATQREEAYRAALRRFHTVLNPRLLDGARRVSPLVVVPETMLRGFVRPATGPGWALVGDAGLFKHPVTAQGIGDALAQGWYVGTALSRGDDLADYARWRDERRPATTSGPTSSRSSRHRTPPPSGQGSPPTPWPDRSCSTPSPGGTVPTRCSAPLAEPDGARRGPTRRASTS